MAWEGDYLGGEVMCVYKTLKHGVKEWMGLVIYC